ncbi:spore coat protein [Bacillus sp. UMB0893]|uniref:spore coat protein n=1 Tax=Bacillus sp. UMB0893 TaxID=2066053 RepID=UPI000C764429|nr:spore coat protein [Bacillus sp. UMB0893]PLR66667.1 spore coat protein [Bacillus sp. UMB0893]
MARSRVIFSDFNGNNSNNETQDENFQSAGTNVSQSARNSTRISQRSSERIKIVDSTDVNLLTIDVQAAAALQAAIQAAITLIVRISFADDIEGADRFTEELFQFARIEQINEQEIIINNSHNINVGALDLDVVITIQVLLQVLAALAISLDIL